MKNKPVFVIEKLTTKNGMVISSYKARVLDCSTCVYRQPAHNGQKEACRYDMKADSYGKDTPEKGCPAWCPRKLVLVLRPDLFMRKV